MVERSRTDLCGVLTSLELLDYADTRGTVVRLVPLLGLLTQLQDARRAELSAATATLPPQTTAAEVLQAMRDRLARIPIGLNGPRLIVDDLDSRGLR